MFWRMTGLSTTSPVDALLDREGFTLEELLDEEELIQECKSLNNRLINFLRGKEQLQQLVKYVIEEPPEGADSKRVFKFPFISCEIFTCEIDVILKSVVEDEELMGLLFSFLDSDRPHGTLLAGYFSKVVICLLVRKTSAVMRYLQGRQHILKQLVDLIGITSIMEVLIRLVSADDTLNGYQEDSNNWLASTDLLEMLIDKLGPPNSSETHANAADTLSAITRLSQSELAAKLSSPSFIARLIQHALNFNDSKSILVHSLTVCISLLDPKRHMMVGMGRMQHVPDTATAANPEVIDSMLQRLGDLLKLLDVQADEAVLPTTYGELCPPLGTHRLKIVEFLAVLLRTNSDAARQQLVELGAIQVILKLFFDYPFNNLLHHQVENIITSCIESNDKMLIDHILVNCCLVERLIAADESPYVRTSTEKPTKPDALKAPTRIGNLGHITRIFNKLVQASNRNSDIQSHLQALPKWIEWQSNVLQIRNSIENLSQWTCGRPTTVKDRPVDSDDDDFRDRDYDISTMASNLSREVFRYEMFDNDDGDEGQRDDDDVFFDDESAEVVISALRLGEENDSARSKDSFLAGSNWFTFSDESAGNSYLAPRFEEGQGTNGSSNSSSSDDDVVVGEDDDLVDTATSSDNAFFSSGLENGVNVSTSEGSGLGAVHDLSTDLGKLSVTDNLSFFQDENVNTDAITARPLDWANWKEPSGMESTSGRMTFSDTNPFKDDTGGPLESPNIVTDVPLDEAVTVQDERVEDGGVSGSITNNEVAASTVQPDGESEKQETQSDENEQPVTTEVAGEIPESSDENEQPVTTEVAGETPESSSEAAEVIHPSQTIPESESEFDPRKKTDVAGDVNFNDVNYWRSDYSQTVAEVESL